MKKIYTLLLLIIITPFSLLAVENGENNTLFDNTVTIEQAGGQTDPTTTASINFTVTFTEAVTGFDAADINLSTSTAPGTLVANISGTGPVYTVTVTGMTGSGVVTATVNAAAALLVSDGSTTTVASTSTDNSVTYDATPSVTVEQDAGQADPTSASPILFKATFSEPVSGLVDADVDLSASTAGGTLVATVTEITPNDGTTYEISVTGMTSSGTIVASLPASAANATLGNSTASAASTSTDNSVTYDAAPSVTVEQAGGQADPTTVSPVLFVATFSEAVSGFTNADVDLSNSTTPGGLAAAVTEIAPNDGTTYQISVSGMTGSGVVEAFIPAAAANAVGGSNTASLLSTSADNQITYDQAPTVTVEQKVGQADPTGTTPVLFTATFSEPITGFTNGDVTIGGTATGTLTAIVTEVAPNDGTTWEIAVSGMTNSGTVIVSLAAGKVIAALGSGTANLASTSTDNTVTFQPDVFIEQAVGQADPTNTSPITFTVTFSAAVSGFSDLSTDVDLLASS
ncbi:MAG: hypothetical protein OEY34_08995, partial [Cyclobacteriaceae bacterium]|nr:hypothetical protein [Cyclobacteriaceae bacterium]